MAGGLVMTGLEDPAAAGSDRLRVGHADREQVIRALKDAFVQGRLTGDEFGERAGGALAARTRGELAAFTADIPADLAYQSAGPRPSLLQRHPLVWGATGFGSGVAVAFGLIVLAANVLDPAGLGNPYRPWSTVCALLALAALFAGIGMALHGAVSAADQRRARKRRPIQPR